MSYNLNTSNLYQKMDEIKKNEDLKNIKEEHNKVLKRKTRNLFINILKIIIVLSIVFVPLYVKYSDYTLQENLQHIISYFNDFDSKSNQLDNSTKKIAPKTIDNMKKSIKAPTIIITGSIMKDNTIYMVFNYRNMIMTKTIGDFFDNGNYKIVNIYGNNMDIADIDGNIYTYSENK